MFVLKTGCKSTNSVVILIVNFVIKDVKNLWTYMYLYGK